MSPSSSFGINSGSISSIFGSDSRISSRVEASISTTFFVISPSPLSSFLETSCSPSSLFVSFLVNASPALLFSSSSDFVPTEIFPVCVTLPIGSSIDPV